MESGRILVKSVDFLCTGTEKLAGSDPVKGIGGRRIRSIQEQRNILLIRLIGKLSRKKEEQKPAPAPAPEPSAEEKLLTEIRDLLKKQQK